MFCNWPIAAGQNKGGGYSAYLSPYSKTTK